MKWALCYSPRWGEVDFGPYARPIMKRRSPDIRSVRGFSGLEPHGLLCNRERHESPLVGYLHAAGQDHEVVCPLLPRR